MDDRCGLADMQKSVRFNVTWQICDPLLQKEKIRAVVTSRHTGPRMITCSVDQDLTDEIGLHRPKYNRRQGSASKFSVIRNCLVPGILSSV